MKVKMILKRIKVYSNLAEPTNCYIVADETTREAMVIDPGGEAEKIIEMMKILNVNLKYIVLTHCHGDHIGAVTDVQKNLGGKILIHVIEAEGLNNKDISLTGYIGMPEIKLEPDSRVNDEDLIHIGNIEFRIIHTPGHTKGGTCLYAKEEKLLLSGDTLFKGTWGRTDLPTSSFEAIINSITNKLMVLPDDTIVYPGHGRMTTIREEEPIYLSLQPRKEI